MSIRHPSVVAFRIISESAPSIDKVELGGIPPEIDTDFLCTKRPDDTKLDRVINEHCYP